MKIPVTISTYLFFSALTLSTSHSSPELGAEDKPKDPVEALPAPDQPLDPGAPVPEKINLPAKNSASFHPDQLTGEPDTPRAGDYGTCWAASTMDGGKEWLELDYGKRVRPIAVWVYENCAPGAVFQITGLSDGEEIQLWRGVDPTPRTEPKGISKIIVDPKHKLDAIRVYLDCKRVTGWNEIDAVAILDQDEELRWAVSAKATTSYARIDPLPFVDPFQPPREAFEEKFADVETRTQQHAQAVKSLKSELNTHSESLRNLQAEMKALKREYKKLQKAESPKHEPAKEATTPIATRLEGFWALDDDAFEAMMLAELGKQGGVDEAMKTMLKPLIDAMKGKMLLELRDGKSKTYHPFSGKGMTVDHGTYKFTATNDAAGTFSVVMVTDGEETEGEGRISGSTMKMSADGSTFTMTRLSKVEFENRLEELEGVEFDPSDLLQPVPQAE